IGLLRLVTRSRPSPRLARWTANAALAIDWRAFGPPMGCVFSFGPQRSKGRRYDDGELAAITSPTLILIGGRSRLFHPASAAVRVRELVPHARVETIARAGHGIPFEFPDEVNASILSHLARV
ncbi:MAG TPA: alpha/beta hydrolase, partial [Phytomonospora sp.]